MASLTDHTMKSIIQIGPNFRSPELIKNLACVGSQNYWNWTKNVSTQKFLKKWGPIWVIGSFGTNNWRVKSTLCQEIERKWQSWGNFVGWQDVKLTSFGEEGIGLAAGRDFKVCHRLNFCAYFLFLRSHQIQSCYVEAVCFMDIGIAQYLFLISILRLFVTGPGRGDCFEYSWELHSDGSGCCQPPSHCCRCRRYS